MKTHEATKSGKARVLLVDDCDDSREMYAEFLSPWFDIVEAATGTEALEQAAATNPHAIVMDMMLPDMTGEEAIVALRRNARTRTIPIVVVSGFSEPSQSEKIWDAYLTKPCRPDLLTDCINRIIAERPTTNARAS
jgi:CheY-like chemotaxis protein